MIAFIHITLATHSPDNAKRFRALVNRVDHIQEAYSLTGDADYLLKAVLRDLKSLSDIVNNVLMPHQSVAHVRSSIVLDRLKESSKLPLLRMIPKCMSEIEGNSSFACGFRFAMIRPRLEHGRRPWRCNSGRTANIATRTCRRDSTDARICSYECTFCADCAAEQLDNVCPNCGGGFAPRPIRPSQQWRSGRLRRDINRLRPNACTSNIALNDIAAHSEPIRDIPPEER